jgi:hypothetical protein
MTALNNVGARAQTWAAVSSGEIARFVIKVPTPLAQAAVNHDASVGLVGQVTSIARVGSTVKRLSQRHRPERVPPILQVGHARFSP